VDVEEIHTSLVRIGSIRSLIRSLNDIEWKIVIKGNSDEYTIIKNYYNHQLSYECEYLLDPDILDNLPINTTFSTFLDVLTGNIMNELRSFQGWLNKIKRGKRNELIKELNLLKVNYTDNHLRIFRLERELNNIIEQDIAGYISNLKLFENLTLILTAW
jgi:hypothetical protein